MLHIRRIIISLLFFALLFTAPGCKSSGPAATTAPPELPEVTAAPGKATAPPVSRYQGFSLRIKPVTGPEFILREPIGAQLIMDAYSTERLEVKQTEAQFKNKMDVLGPDDKVQYSFTLASDGQILMRHKDGRVSHMPEYVYYLIERGLWNYNGSLVEKKLKWQPEKGSAQLQLQLELELSRLIETAMQPAYGYAMAYFCSYKIYSVNTKIRDTAKVYILMTYAGYDIDGNAFAPKFLLTTPATLILKKDASDSWVLTDLKQPPNMSDKSNQYANIRTIFPYECMEQVTEDLKDTSGQVKDIVQQATEYLNNMGISGLTVES